MDRYVDKPGTPLNKRLAIRLHVEKQGKFEDMNFVQLAGCSLLAAGTESRAGRRLSRWANRPVKPFRDCCRSRTGTPREARAHNGFEVSTGGFPD